MRKSPNKLWAFGPPLSLLLLAFAYYVKVPSFRDTVDRHFPWAKEHLAQFVIEPTVVMIKDPRNAAEINPTPSPPDDASPETSTSVPVKKKKKTKANATPAPEVHEEPLTMERFVANPSLWPKKVRLRKPTEFPAVLNGKPVGKLQAPAGTEANLLKIKDQQVGVEFQGGGAWVPIAETDLMDQVKITSH